MLLVARIWQQSHVRTQEEAAGDTTQRAACGGHVPWRTIALLAACPSCRRHRHEHARTRTKTGRGDSQVRGGEGGRRPPRVAKPAPPLAHPSPPAAPYAHATAEAPIAVWQQQGMRSRGGKGQGRPGVGRSAAALVACSSSSKAPASDAGGHAPRLYALNILNACIREGLSELLLDKVEGILDACSMRAERYHKRKCAQGPLPHPTPYHTRRRVRFRPPQGQARVYLPENAEERRETRATTARRRAMDAKHRASGGTACGSGLCATSAST